MPGDIPRRRRWSLLPRVRDSSSPVRCRRGAVTEDRISDLKQKAESSLPSATLVVTVSTRVLSATSSCVVVSRSLLFARVVARVPAASISSITSPATSLPANPLGNGSDWHSASELSVLVLHFGTVGLPGEFALLDTIPSILPRMPDRTSQAQTGSALGNQLSMWASESAPARGDGRDSPRSLLPSDGRPLRPIQTDTYGRRE